MTIDALCQMLNRSIPLLNKALPFAMLTESPNIYYQQAARACLHDAVQETSTRQCIFTLLDHLDNRQDLLIQLFSTLLSYRDQWLEIIFTAKSLTKDQIEMTLKHIEQRTIERFIAEIPKHLLEELHDLSKRMAIVRNDLFYWDDIHTINRDIASNLAALWLNQNNTMRSSFDHHIGLRKGRIANTIYYDLKKRSQELSQDLQNIPGFVPNLIAIKQLPLTKYSSEQWCTLQSLLTLLPMLAAELHIIFQQNNCIDFTAVTQQALQGLGDNENPTDLTLYLDATIQHLLIDEFQDTSIPQMRLLEKLVQGWDPYTAKTLFLVGDPMQSIYRFRQAEVSLFLQVKQQGLGPVKLTPLNLSSNFRADPSLVTWANAHFKYIFPNQDIMEYGAVSFNQSHATLSADVASSVHAQQFDNHLIQADHIIALIKHELSSNPQNTIAILVRSRRQLTDIVRKLREHAIVFQGVEIEKLFTLRHIKDIWSLTNAILQPTNRLAWLAFLRSPWCGLHLDDLYILSNFDKNKSIYHALNYLQQHAELPTKNQLSSSGKQRALFVFNIIKQSIATRNQQSLVDLIMRTTEQLHIKAILEPQQMIDLESFWKLLEKHATFDQLNYTTFQEEFTQLYSQQTTTSQLQIMTIHKAKGLEFDTVIIPTLSSQSKNHEKPLIRWLQIQAADKEHLLISPIQAKYAKESILYKYLENIEQEKAHYELQRLFYVATTRAKKKLYLFDIQNQATTGSFRSLLKHQDFVNMQSEITSEPEFNFNPPQLYHLPLDYYTKACGISEPGNSFSATLQLQSHAAKQFGIIAHECLQWICTYHPHDLSSFHWELIKQRFQSISYPESKINTAILSLQQQLNDLLLNPIGKWICKQHQEEQNEYELLIMINGQTHTRIIDRTFVENNQRWIIDFKTGENSSKQQLQHELQVNEYANYMNSIQQCTINCGLYYLNSQQWSWWNYQDTATFKKNHGSSQICQH